MVPEIYPQKFHNEYYNISPKPSDKVMSFIGRYFICNYNNEICIPAVSDFPEGILVYLFKIDDISYFLWQGENYIPNGYEKLELQKIRSIGNTKNYLEIYTAWHLNVWYRDNSYCGRCGALTKIGQKERNILCDCGNIIFPKIMPAVIVGVRSGNKLLMTRYANRAYKGLALIAGFIEIGETAEEAVIREVKEETDIDVENVKYYCSQPWGIDQDLLLGFFCDAVGKSDIHLDKEELAVGEWVDRSDIPIQERTDSLTATLMESFRRGLDSNEYHPL